MHRLILMVAGLTMCIAIGGQSLKNDSTKAQDTSGVVAATFTDYARQSLKVGDKVLYAGPTVVLLTEEQSEKLSTYPRDLATVTGIGKDYFVVRAEVSRGTYSQAFGTRTIEKVVHFEAITEFQKYVIDKDQLKSP